MHNPVVGDNRLKETARGFVTIANQWWFAHLLRPFLFLIPVTWLIAAISRQGLQEELVGILGKRIGGFVEESSLIALLALFALIAVSKAIYAGIEHYSRPTKTLSQYDILAILIAINGVVSEKYKRFSSHVANALNGQAPSAGEIFSSITQPEQQIPLLIAALRNVFMEIDGTSAQFRVGLLRVIDGKPTEWFAFEPTARPPRTSAEQLSAPSSTVMRSVKTRSLVVVDDIQAELARGGNKKERRYLRGSTQPHENGSQLCYPILSPGTNDVDYVITVAGNKKRCLREKYRELYDWFLVMFAERIRLEHCLIMLKERSHEHRSKDQQTARDLSG